MIAFLSEPGYEYELACLQENLTYIDAHNACAYARLASWKPYFFLPGSFGVRMPARESHKNRRTQKFAYARHAPWKH